MKAPLGICEVHKYALKDETPRPVMFCELCNANICEECTPNLALRALAMVIKAKEQLTEKLKS